MYGLSFVFLRLLHVQQGAARRISSLGGLVRFKSKIYTRPQTALRGISCLLAYPSIYVGLWLSALAIFIRKARTLEQQMK